jgi:hypothetical protein
MVVVVVVVVVVGSAMVGSKIDQDVFEFLVANQLPAVHKHLAELMYGPVSD